MHLIKQAISWNKDNYVAWGEFTLGLYMILRKGMKTCTNYWDKKSRKLSTHNGKEGYWVLYRQVKGMLFLWIYKPHWKVNHAPMQITVRLTWEYSNVEK